MNIVQQRRDQLIAKFKELPKGDEVYSWIIDFGKDFPGIEPENKTSEFEVKGCQSPTWLFAELKGDKVFYQGDSDAVISKGVMALLLSVYNESTPDEILSVKPDFLKEVGISDHLSVNRANGMASMAKKIHYYAFAFQYIQKKHKIC